MHGMSRPQAGTMYEEVERLFNGAALANYFDKSWGQHVSLKASIYQVCARVEGGRAVRRRGGECDRPGPAGK